MCCVTSCHGLDTIRSHRWEWKVCNSNRVKFSSPSLMCRTASKLVEYFTWTTSGTIFLLSKIKCWNERWKAILHPTGHVCLQYPQYDPGFSMLQSNGKPGELRLLKSVLGETGTPANNASFTRCTIHNLFPRNLQCSFVVAQIPSLPVAECVLQGGSDGCK